MNVTDIKSHKPKRAVEWVATKEFDVPHFYERAVKVFSATTTVSTLPEWRDNPIFVRTFVGIGGDTRPIEIIAESTRGLGVPQKKILATFLRGLTVYARHYRRRNRYFFCYWGYSGDGKGYGYNHPSAKKVYALGLALENQQPKREYVAGRYLAQTTKVRNARKIAALQEEIEKLR
jgi:hypothetical protein